MPCHQDPTVCTCGYIAQASERLFVQLQEDLTSFMVVFVGSPLHVKNPYLRAKFVEILADWLPERCPPGTTRNIMTGLFEGHPLAIQVLVPNLLRLYVDIEFTGSHTQVSCTRR